jgi:hypothetical protein
LFIGILLEGYNGMNLYLCLPAAVFVSSFILLSLSALVENTYGQLNRYWVALTSGRPVPPGVAEPIGFVGFKFGDDFNELTYNVNVHNIDDITGAYLYLKKDTQHKTPVLDLLKKYRESNREDDRWSNKTKEGQITGTINLTGITHKELTGPLKGKSIQDLHKLMVNDALYVIIYTTDFTNGELIGNSFVGMDDVFHDDKFNW